MNTTRIVGTAAAAAVVASLVTTGFPSAANAANTPGGRCSKAGITVHVGNVDLRCTKKGSKLVWVKLSSQGGGSGSGSSAGIASNGYPESPVTGDLISGLDEAGAIEGVTVLHAGTRATDAGIVSAGGRVLSVTAQGESLALARSSAYAAVDLISIDGAQHRSDIALAAALSQ